MSRWKYSGFVKVKNGSGRHARMIGYWDYSCPDCLKSIRVERTMKPPMECPNCGADMRGKPE